MFDPQTLIPLAIGVSVEIDENETTEAISLITQDTFPVSSSRHSCQELHVRREQNDASSRRRKKRKRKEVNEEEDPEESAKSSSKKKEDDDKDPRGHPPRGMSGRRHSGFIYRGCNTVQFF